METTPKSDRVDGQLEIAVADQVTDELVEALSKLIPQLTSLPIPTPAHLERVIAADNSQLLIARWAGEIVGSLTLVNALTPTTVGARIEDVVVDQQARGKGIGKALTELALEMAQADGIQTVGLNSQSHRQAAQRLYLSLGFQRSETDVFRWWSP